jgi:hypothetical protein
VASDPQALASSRRWLEPRRPTILPAPLSSSRLAFEELLEEISSREETTQGKTLEKTSRPARLLSPPPPPSSRRTIPGLHETVVAPADPETSERLERTQPFDRRILAGKAFVSEPALPVAAPALSPSPPASASRRGAADTTTSISPITLDGATAVLSTRGGQQTVRLAAAPLARPRPRSSLRPALLSMFATVVGVAAVVLASQESSGATLPSAAGLDRAAPSPSERREHERDRVRPRALVLGTAAQDVPPAIAPAASPPPRRRIRRPPPSITPPAARAEADAETEPSAAPSADEPPIPPPPSS